MKTPTQAARAPAAAGTAGSHSTQGQVAAKTPDSGATGTAAAYPVLLVPATERGRGSGHIRRSAALARSLRRAGRPAFLYLAEHPSPAARGAGELLESFPGELEPELVFSGDPSERPWGLVVLDRFRCSLEEARAWASLAPTVGLDEGGAARAGLDYLIDTLGPGDSGCTANEADTGFLSLPRRRAGSEGASLGRSPAVPSSGNPSSSGDPAAPPEATDIPGAALPPSGAVGAPVPPGFRILVSFGGEDGAGLGRAAAAALSSPGMRGPSGFCRIELDLILPSLGDVGAEGDGTPGCADAAPGGMVVPGTPRLRALPPQRDLKERLADYDLVVCQYGITAFEAAWAGVPVLLVSPTRYHERLARRAGFVSAGVGKRAAARLGGYLGRLPELAVASAEAAPRERRDLAATLASLVFPSGTTCPACGAPSDPTVPYIARFPDRSYRRCASCGTMHLIRSRPQSIRYGKDYFFEEYRAQYGLTYLEDFPSLMAAGARRAGMVRSVLGLSGGVVLSGAAQGAKDAPTVLDLGCAYGPFLAAAAESGFRPYGMDPSEDAVRYVSDELRLPARVGFFPESDPRAAFGVDRFDAVTLWYVIEHFSGLRKVLDALAELVRPGGVLALSTPSLAGVSGRSDLSRFLERSPEDHYTIWDPRRCGALLAAHGFELVQTVSTGHHPERFPLMGEVPPASPLFRAVGALSRAFALGDTFEVYARRLGAVSPRGTSGEAL